MTHSLPETPADDGVTLGVSPKALAAALAPLVVGVVLSAFFAVLDSLAASPELFAALPGWAQLAIGGALAALVAGTAAYRARPGVVVPGTGSQES